MVTIQSENVKVPYSVIVTGLSETVVDDEIIDYLKQYGPIARVIKSRSRDHVIVEFGSAAALKALEGVLPLDRPTDINTDIVHHVEALASVYSCERGTGITQTFLSELKDMANLSGKSFEQVLRDELSRITVFTGEQMGEQGQEDIVEGSTPVAPPSVVSLIAADTKKDPPVLESDFLSGEASSTFRAPAIATPGLGDSLHTFNLSHDHLTPPEVQRVVVEHIVKSTDLPPRYHSSAKLRPFSGRVPCPSFEVDYDTWRGSVEFHIADPTISSAQLVRKIVDSLMPPAANVVKSLGPQSNPRAYLDLLDSAYATVEDGDELFAKFLSINQNSGEKPSSYLHRLQTLLNKVVKMKAISTKDADKQLLKQFCRGCWNNSLISTLQLEQKKENPPTFAELLLLLRTEEDKQAAKSNRMKQHLGFVKTKVQSQAHNVCLSDGDEYDSPAPVNTPPSARKQMQKQIVDLQAQLTTLLHQKEGKSDKNKGAKKRVKPKEESVSVRPPPAQPASVAKKPRPWYCYRCGEDGHIASSCTDPPNPILVDAKRKDLRAKQQAWEKENATDTDSSTLN